MRRFLVVGCGGSGGATLAFIMDQLRSELHAAGIEKLLAGWQFVQIDVPSAPETGPEGLANVPEQGGTYIGCGPQGSSYANKLQAGAIINSLYSVLGTTNAPAPGTSSALAQLAQAQTQYNLGNNAYSTGDFATARKLGAAEIVIYAQFLPEGESAKDLVVRMEDIWNIATQA